VDIALNLTRVEEELTIESFPILRARLEEISRSNNTLKDVRILRFRM